MKKELVKISEQIDGLNAKILSLQKSTNDLHSGFANDPYMPYPFSITIYLIQDTIQTLEEFKLFSVPYKVGDKITLTLAGHFGLGYTNELSKEVFEVTKIEYETTSLISEYEDCRINKEYSSQRKEMTRRYIHNVSVYVKKL